MSAPEQSAVEALAVWLERFKERDPQDALDFGYNQAINEVVRELRTPTPGSELSPLNLCQHPNRHPVYNGVGEAGGFWSCPDCGATNTATLTAASAPPSLDVERLARALCYGEHRHAGDQAATAWTLLTLEMQQSYIAWARRIAAAYSEASAEPKDGGE